MTHVLCPIVVGRDAELDALAIRLDEARQGRGGVVVVTGEAGIGKSRMLDELRHLATNQGFSVRSGRASERATGPYRPLREALIDAVAEVGAGGSDGHAEDPFRAILGQLWNGDDTADGMERLALAEAIRRYLDRQATRTKSPCLLLLEDLHWADTETLEIVEYLADHLWSSPVLCVTAVRTGEGTAGDRWSTGLSPARAQVLRLDPLSEHDVARMAEAYLGAPGLPEQLVPFLASRSGGLPLGVEELLAGLLSDDALIRDGARWRVVSRLVPRVPVTVAESIHRRLRSLPSYAADVIDAAAMLGQSFEWRLLGPMTGCSEDQVLEALRNARDVQIIDVDDSTGFHFRHALTRDSVIEALLPPERVRLAALGADAIEALSPDLGEEWCGLAAELSAIAGRPERTASLLVEAARHALARGAVATASEGLSRARSMAPRHQLAEIDEVAAEAAALAGEVDEAVTLARTALSEQAAAADPSTTCPREARLRLILGRALLNAGRWDEASGEAVAARAVADRCREPSSESLVATADAVAALAAVAAGRLDDARALAERAVQKASMCGAAAPACEAFEVLGRIARLQDPGRAERYFEEAYATAEAHGLALWRSRALAELGTIDLFTTLRTDRLEEARRSAPPGLLAVIELHLASIAHARWEKAASYEAAVRCVDLSRRMGLSTLGMGLVHLAASASWIGHRDAEVEELVAEAVEVAGDAVDVAAGVPGRVRLKQALMRADMVAARAHLDVAIEILRRDPATGFPFRGLWALLRTLDDDEGEACRTEASTSAGGSVPVNASAVTLAEAVELGRSGDRDGAARSAAEAFAALEPMGGNGGWIALMQLLVAPSAHRDGWGDGAAWLRSALSTFDRVGDDSLTRACRSRLGELGIPVPRRGRGDSHVPGHLQAMGVTSREMDVLNLLEEKLTNREIADRLSLSIRTVDRHVANLLTKTGTTGRHEVAALVHAP